MATLKIPIVSQHRQDGLVIVETAICMILFFGLAIGVIEFGRLAYTYATAVEATRIGARLAVVCDAGDADIKAKMIAFLPQLSASYISITYPTAGCIPPACEPVKVAILPGVNVQLSIPLAPITVSLPAFSTSLLPESMNSTNNAACG